MLTKVLKYDFRDIYRQLGPLYLIVVFIAALSMAFYHLMDRFPIFQFVWTTLQVLFIFLLVGSIIATIFFSVRRFYKNILTDQGYLTNTLPVKMSTHLCSKMMVAIISIITTISVILLALWIAYSSTGIVDSLRVFMTGAAEMIGLSVPMFLLGCFAYILIGMLSNILMIEASITIGQLYSAKRLLYAVSFWVVLYMVNQIVSLIGLGIYMLTKPGLMDTLSKGTTDPNIFLGIFGIAGCVYVILSIAYFFVTHTILKNRLNLE